MSLKPIKHEARLDDMSTMLDVHAFLKAKPCFWTATHELTSEKHYFLLDGDLVFVRDFQNCVFDHRAMCKKPKSGTFTKISIYHDQSRFSVSFGFE